MPKRKKKPSNKRAVDLRFDHAAQMRRVERAGIGEWQHPAELIEAAPEIGMIMELAARLSKILQWVSDGSVGGTMDMRTWAMLYVMRPDLIRGETMRQYAKRRGVSWSRINGLVREFRALFPAVEFAGGSRVARSEQDEDADPPEGISLDRPLH